MFEAGSALVQGNGISTKFDRFEASIFHTIEDFDNDGSDDTTLDVVIDFEVPASGDPEGLLAEL